jgi:predicted nucleotide-binding protein (sugar kinase/HSP70/actin superfamily)
MIPLMTSDPDQYYKIPFSFYESSFIDASNAVAQALSTSTQFNMKLYNVFTTAYHIYINTISEYNKSWKDLSELDKVLRSKFLNALDEKFREKEISLVLSQRPLPPLRN